MLSPTVIELSRHLEPIARDTFNDAGRDAPEPDRPAPSNVVDLFATAAAGRRSDLAVA